MACGEDETIYETGNITINTDGYTMGGNIKILYSNDGGNTFKATAPSVAEGSEITVKLNNGTTDLTTEYFNIEWSISNLEGETPTSSSVSFTVNSEVDIEATVSDKTLLITSLRSSGEFFSLDENTGDKTALFTATYNEGALTGLRGFAYHSTLEKLFVTQTQKEGGQLFTIDPKSKEATLISNSNEWDAIANWGVTEDGNLIGLGFINTDNTGTSLVKFSSDGNLSTYIPIEGVCCGLGMILDAKNEEIIFVDSYLGIDNGLVVIDKIDFDGNVSDMTSITTVEGFPSKISNAWLQVKALVQNNDNSIYGILSPYNTKASYFVKFDLENSKIVYISTLGSSKDEQYNVLAYIPKYAL